MKPLLYSALLLLLLLGIAGCAPRDPEPPTVQVVTVVVSPTVGPTQTPIIITEVQTVVVTATPARTGTPRADATASPQPEATPTPGLPSPTVAPPPPTSTPRPALQNKYGAPQLAIPVDQELFGADTQPILRWATVPLAEDEYFEVTIERLWQNQPFYSGSDWLKEPEMLVPTFVRGTSDTDQYTWWVTIKRLTGSNSAGGKVGEAISPPSEQRTFIWSRE